MIIANDLTVITPTIHKDYRREYLSLMLEDMQNQQLQPYEHIIRVNTTIEDSYISLNKAIELARTPIVAICNDDDRYGFNHLSSLYELIKDGVDLAYSGCKRIGLKSGECCIKHNSKLLRKSNYITNPMFKKYILTHTGMYGSDSVNEDHILYKKIDEKGFKIVCTNEITWEYRFHNNNESEVK